MRTNISRAAPVTTAILFSCAIFISRKKPLLQPQYSGGFQTPFA